MRAISHRVNGQTYLIDLFGSIAHRELIAPIPACQVTGISSRRPKTVVGATQFADVTRTPTPQKAPQRSPAWVNSRR